MTQKVYQNIYDNPVFFDGYFQLRKNEQGFNALLEQPALRSLLPEVKGKNIVDLGCGFGDLCRFLREKGAASVLGIDISEKMLAVARQRTEDAAIKYEHCPIEEFSIPAFSVDLVVSSLALHYIANYPAVVNNVYRWLKKGGSFIFSVEHPICTANPACKTVHDDKQEIWPVYNYRDEKQFTQTWFIDNVIKYHRKLETYVNVLIETGFIIEKIVEPMPTDALIKERNDFSMHTIRPPLLIIKSYKNFNHKKL